MTINISIDLSYSEIVLKIDYFDYEHKKNLLCNDHDGWYSIQLIFSIHMIWLDSFTLSRIS